jgi:hypothetical protein
MWCLIPCAESTRSAPPFLSISLSVTGPHKDRNITPLPCCDFLPSDPIFEQKYNSKMEYSSNGNKKLQIIYRWKTLIKENPLKQLFLKMVHCTSLALEGKEIELEMELAG